ncbi:Uncharacterised protein [Vibrio cholerae]|uniref:Uncharacterized protein n=1 Tax=Vibrio cholerae TaxID=666 RepID=A0A656ABZ5_VIBCL|nr:Uncharacterised protein [Vibrio cholerae]CSD01117.1 Uncharacterised protein [Vibrio cholerae]
MQAHKDRGNTSKHAFALDSLKHFIYSVQDERPNMDKQLQVADHNGDSDRGQIKCVYPLLSSSFSDIGDRCSP